MAEACGLAPRERIRRRQDFERAYSEGTRLHARFMTLFVVRNACEHPRLGVAASRKLGAAVRSKSREAPGAGAVQAPQDRTSFRGRPGLDVVIVPRREMLDAPFAALEADYTRCHRAVCEGVCPTGSPQSASPSFWHFLSAISCFFHRCLPDPAGITHPAPTTWRRPCVYMDRGAVSGSGADVWHGAIRLAATASTRSRIRSLRTWNAGSSSQFFCRLPSCTAIRRSSSLPRPRRNRQSRRHPRRRARRGPQPQTLRLRRAHSPRNPPLSRLLRSQRLRKARRTNAKSLSTPRRCRSFSRIAAVACCTGGSRTSRIRAGNQVDLVPTDVPSDQPRPFSLIVDDGTLTQRLNNALYRVSGDTDGHVDATSQPAQLVFEFEGAGGLRVRKEFGFDAEQLPRHVLGERQRTANARCSRRIAWGPGLGDAGALAAGGSFFTGNYTQPPEAIFHRDGSWRACAPRTSWPSSRFDERPIRFAGVDDHYFIAAAIEPGQGRLEYRPVDRCQVPASTKRSAARAHRLPIVGR